MAQIVGKFLKMMPPVEGEKDGRYWIRCQFAIMTMDSNAKMVAFDAFGEDRVSIVQQLQVGNTVIVEYSPESREYNDRYYTNLNCNRIQIAQKMEAAPMPQPQVNNPQMPDGDAPEFA